MDSLCNFAVMDRVIWREVLVVLSFTLGTGYTLGDGRFVVGLFGRGMAPEGVWGRRLEGSRDHVGWCPLLQ